jgi:hypothetical protein
MGGHYSPSGRMSMTIFAGIAEFRRTLILSRTTDGRLAAEARGVAFGHLKKCIRTSPRIGHRRTRPSREVDQCRCQDLRRPPGDDLPRHRGIEGLMPLSVPLSRKGHLAPSKLPWAIRLFAKPATVLDSGLRPLRLSGTWDRPLSNVKPFTIQIGTRQMFNRSDFSAFCRLETPCYSASSVHGAPSMYRILVASPKGGPGKSHLRA